MFQFQFQFHALIQDFFIFGGGGFVYIKNLVEKNPEKTYNRILMNLPG